MARKQILRVRLTDQEMQCLQAIADSKGISAAEIVRDWIKTLRQSKEQDNG